MRRVAEIIYIVENEREKFLSDALNLDDEAKRVLWLCGVRKQQYFLLNDLIFMTFEYDGHDFYEDMEKMAKYLSTKGVLVQKRRKDVPIEERESTNWWAPVKKLGSLLESRPVFESEDEDLERQSMLGGFTDSSSDYYDISYSDEDWID